MDHDLDGDSSNRNGVGNRSDRVCKLGGLSMKWVRFTRPDGEPLWVSPKQIVLVEPCKMEGQPSVNASVQMVSGLRRYVNETIEEVVDVL